MDEATRAAGVPAPRRWPRLRSVARCSWSRSAWRGGPPGRSGSGGRKIPSGSRSRPGPPGRRGGSRRPRRSWRGWRGAGRRASPSVFCGRRWRASGAEIDQALAALDGFPAAEPGAALIERTRGMLELERDRARPAEEALLRALSLDPKLAEARRDLVNLYTIQSRRRELSDQLRALAAAGPLNFEELYLWCLGRRRTSAPLSGAAKLEKMLESDPDDRPSRLALAENPSPAGTAPGGRGGPRSAAVERTRRTCGPGPAGARLRPDGCRRSICSPMGLPIIPRWPGCADGWRWHGAMPPRSPTTARRWPPIQTTETRSSAWARPSASWGNRRPPRPISRPHATAIIWNGSWRTPVPCPDATIPGRSAPSAIPAVPCGGSPRPRPGIDGPWLAIRLTPVFRRASSTWNARSLPARIPGIPRRAHRAPTGHLERV